MEYIWQRPAWPRLFWDGDALLAPLAAATELRGRLLARLQAVGLAEARRVETLIDEVVTTSAIEGAELSRDAVRSSVARRLGLEHAGLPEPSRDVDGVVEMMLDAATRHAAPLTAERLCGWQAALFPTGYSGVSRITVGAWRTDPAPMQVLSGAHGRQRVHFVAPPAERVPQEMASFLAWWAGPSLALPGMLRAAVAHLRFETVHPFDDGNGRVGRALVELALAQDEGQPQRFYSPSTEILAERQDYYRAIEAAQRGTGEITPWLQWFLGCLARAIQRSLSSVQTALEKERFWREVGRSLNPRQTKVVNRLLDAGRDGFEGGLTNRKYRGMTRAAPATATRDLAQLVQRGVLVRTGEGRSVRYELNWGLVDRVG